VISKNRPLDGAWDALEIRSARTLASAFGACPDIASGRGSKGPDIGTLPPEAAISPNGCDAGL